MAITALPSDGFISRLLQQAHRPAPNAAPQSGQPAAKDDQMTFSNEARQASQPSGSQNLESKLMEMYNQKGKSS
ncbi:hypothetical protein MMIC_P1430 [Mariprofundus micogutta]|uniref:Uncharacterized protein n=1 Tax=Mariprofundus micogutta TaxID=1921010 RepID=A0A1L8CNJ0_9PROT|nr:hypothetical protein [Mariprofundus micogutta]GAV20464.1 hypothetical protein MMIC_P1430 [Mariprofundus micogutta]